jgi:hypothetical protein
MTTPTVIETRRNGNQIRQVGPRVELARYTLPSGERRILYGQRVDGIVRVTDVPAVRGPRAYLIERGLEQDGRDTLSALVADYVLCGYPHKTYYADRLNMPIEAVVSLRNRGLADALSAYSERKGRP